VPELHGPYSSLPVHRQVLRMVPLYETQHCNVSFWIAITKGRQIIMQLLSHCGVGGGDKSARWDQSAEAAVLAGAGASHFVRSR
jgi:hypothetical protein